MCGIMGYFAFGSNRPSKGHLTNAFVSLEQRGRDAAGFAYVRDKELFVSKAPISAKEFVESKAWKGLMKQSLPQSMILHTRAQTQGPKSVSSNNHPLFNKAGYALVHNGIIYNDYKLYKERGYERDGTVDSEILLSVYSAKKRSSIDKRIERVFTEVSGSYAVALLRQSDNRLVLFRHSSPIEVIYDQKTDIMYFASESEYWTDELELGEVVVRGFPLQDQWVVKDFPNDHGMIIGETGIELYKKYEYSPSDWYNTGYSRDWNYNRDHRHYDWVDDDDDIYYRSKYGEDDRTMSTYPSSSALTHYGSRPFQKTRDVEYEKITNHLATIEEDGGVECVFCGEQITMDSLKGNDDLEALEFKMHSKCFMLADSGVTPLRKEKRCVACNASGISSNGGDCAPCSGTGYIKVPVFQKSIKLLSGGTVDEEEQKKPLIL